MKSLHRSFGVVVLNWNNADDTLSCLDALQACNPQPEYVVVVDNGSEDDSLDRIRAWNATADYSVRQGHRDPPTILLAGWNRGFAGGTNVGIRHLMASTTATHIMLLNNDAVVAPEFFARLGESLDKFPRAGILGPTIMENPARDRVWYAGGVEHPLRALVKHGRTIPASMEPLPTDFVTGCAMVIAREVVEKVGALAECYFPAYFEDGDFCHRAREAGFSVVYAPRPVVYHKVGATVGAANIGREMLFHRNRLRVVYVRRNYKGHVRLLALSYLAVTKPGRAMMETLKARPRDGWAIASGMLHGFFTDRID